jgi:NADP-dependent 3-hydroxy acid dehydrogenase YdfG
MAKVIVITGASAGIGAALATKAAAAGHQVVLAARRKDELDKVARPLGDAARTVVADVTRRADVNALRDAAIAAFGHVDVWVNNAGRGIQRPVLELDDQDIDEMITVNVKSVLYGMQAILPHLKERGRGHVINVSSFLGRVPIASIRSAYSAAKAYLNSLTANARVDVHATHPDVHVTLVLPGIVLTDFGKNVRGAAPAPGAIAPGGPFAGTPMAGPMKPQTTDEVAQVMLAHLEAEPPPPEVYTNPAHPEVARRYLADIAAFEAEAARR